MRKFKILYMEHDLIRTGIKDAMEDAGAEVEMFEVPEKGLERFEEVGDWDLVVTDVYFLKKGEPHIDDVTEEQYRLDTIIDRIQKVDANMPIIVLTNFAPNLVSLHKKDFTRVTDIWGKSISSMDLVGWKIERLIEQKLPKRSCLIERLSDLLKEDSGNECPWKKELRVSLKNIYLDASSETEADQVAAVKEEFTKIANKIEFTGFSVFFEHLKSAEIFNVAGKPSAWGHLRHSLHVFWLGYYMLNCGLFDINVLADNMKLSDVPGGLSKSEQVNFIWFVTALFHDLGLLGERVGPLVKECASLLKNYSVKFELSSKLIDGEGYKKQLDNVFFHIRTFFEDDIHDAIQNMNSIDTSKLNHGVLSACCILNFLEKKHEYSKIMEIAAASVALHNFANQKDMPKLTFSKAPIACLLILCDQIQAWERETGQETSLYSDFKNFELTKLEYNHEKKTLEGLINCIPASTEDSRQRVASAKYTEIFSTGIRPPLLKILFPKDIKIKIDFKLNGRTDIGIFESNSVE